MRRRVAITGIGIVSSLGHSAAETWQAVLSRRSGITNYVKDPVLRNPSRPYALGLVKDFDVSKWKVPHASSRMNGFLSCAVAETIQDSRFPIQEASTKAVTGVSIGCMSSNITKLTEFLDEANAKGPELINRLTMMHILSNIPAATVSVKYGLQGPSGSSSTACATGLTSVIEAYKWIRDGDAESAIAGGVEDVYNSTCLFSSIRLQAMTTKQYERPQQSSRPFDQGRSGFVLGQGAGVLILQQLSSAQKRNAKIYGEIVGYGCTSDGSHLTRPEPNGDGILRAMKRALEQSSTPVEQLDHINCHATSTPVGDEAEARAIEQLIGKECSRISLSAYKSNLGHTFGAAGSIELALSLLSMKDGTVPGILNLQKPCSRTLLIPVENFQSKIRCMLKNALGFGGINVSLVVRAL